MLLLSKLNRSKRPYVASFDDLVKTCIGSFGKFSLYNTVYCNNCLRQSKFNRVFIDLDNERGPEYSYKDMQEVATRFPTGTYYFTGKNGFACYLTFPKIRLTYPKHAIRQFVQLLEQDLKLNTVDWHVIGDLNRVSRIPYTVNVKNDKVCIPVDPEWSYDKIMQESNRVTEYLPALGKPIPVVADMIKGFDTKPEFESESIDFKKLEEKQNEKFVREVLQMIEIAPNIPDMRHRMTFNLIVPRLVMSGFKDSEIISIVKEFISKALEAHPDPEGHTWEGDYYPYLLRDLQHTRSRVEHNEPLRYSITRFVQENPDSMEFFKLVK